MDLSGFRIAEEPYYEPSGQEVGIVEAAFRQRLPVMLKGPTGCGKTRFVEHVAWRPGRPLVTVSCHEDMTAADLVGRFLLAAEGTVWHDGPLTLAVRHGAICYLDEVVEAAALNGRPRRTLGWRTPAEPSTPCCNQFRLALRRPVELGQYACRAYQAALNKAGITPSMSRRSNPLDNAPMESFFHTLKTELAHHRTYAIRDEAKRDLFAYVEGFYNRQGLHSALDYHTPDQAERRAAHVA